MLPSRVRRRRSSVRALARGGPRLSGREGRVSEGRRCSGLSRVLRLGELAVSVRRRGWKWLSCRVSSYRVEPRSEVESSRVRRKSEGRVVEETKSKVDGRRAVRCSFGGQSVFPVGFSLFVHIPHPRGGWIGGHWAGFAARARASLGGFQVVWRGPAAGGCYAAATPAVPGRHMADDPLERALQAPPPGPVQESMDLSLQGQRKTPAFPKPALR